MAAARVEITLPVYVRVGDGREEQVGTVTVGSGTEVLGAAAQCLRETAAELERLLAADRLVPAVDVG